MNVPKGKVGQSVLKNNGLTQGMTWKRYDKDDEIEILRYIQSSTHPIRQKDIEVAFKISAYTTKAILMNLIVENKIEAFRSGKEVFYKAKNDIFRLFPKIDEREDRFIVSGEDKEIIIEKSDVQKMLETKTLDEVVQIAYSGLLRKGLDVEPSRLKIMFSKVNSK